MSGIWSNRVDYSSPVSKAHWMESGYLFPVIAYKYKIRQLVLYDNSDTHTQSVDGGCCFTTHVIVTTKQNALNPLIQYLDWFMTLVPAGMRVWFSFVTNLISCCLSILIHVHKIYD